MQPIDTGSLKAVIHSKRANLYYLEHCRVLVQGGRVAYLTDSVKESLYWNIPIANTTCLLLGTGTSLTQAAMRELTRAGVMVGFCGGDGTPLLAGTERDPEVSWLSPQSEYRPTEYLQAWLSFWFDEDKRLAAAKQLQRARLGLVERLWLRKRDAPLPDLAADSLATLLQRTALAVDGAQSVAHLLTTEAQCSKQLYALAAKASGYGAFTRAERNKSVDPANRFLDHGNYLAYGLAATATWVLGLPHGLALMHGKTRRGALVFDVADLVKDAVVLPQAFRAAAEGQNERQFREACVAALVQTESLDFMLDTMKAVARPPAPDESAALAPQPA